MYAWIKSLKEIWKKKEITTYREKKNLTKDYFRDQGEEIPRSKPLISLKVVLLL